MRKVEVIERIKAYYSGKQPDGSSIDDKTSRDKVLFGEIDEECTGVMTTCFASIAVIEDAIAKGANLIIVHEALFYNHGDHQEWLSTNQVYLYKKELLKRHHITVWRNHDYIHSGMLVDNEYVDGIFYGVMKALQWEEYVLPNNSMLTDYLIPPMSAQKVAQHLITTLGLKGLRLIGDKDATITRVKIPLHVMGQDNAIIETVDTENIDGLIALELVDYTLSEYIRDAAQAGQTKAIFSVGHFNLEEPGMAYMVEYLPEVLNNQLPVFFSKSGDSFDYITPVSV